MKRSSRYPEGLFSAISVGFFFIVVGVIFTITPDLFSQIVAFFQDFALVSVPNQPDWVLLPAPTFPSRYDTLYLAVTQLSFALGIFQIFVLMLRSIARSPGIKKAETVSNVVFWLGTGFLANMFLLQTVRWFVFWATIIMLIGVSLITRAIVLAAVRT